MAQNRGYILGRLFTLLAAQGGLEKAPEQLYQLASTAPPQVFPKALATLIEGGKEEIIFPLMAQLPLDAFDGPLNRREQGAFALGYVHEKTGYRPHFMEDEYAEHDATLAERYEFRIDAELKEWIKLRGGGAFIRDMLRTQRAAWVQENTQEQPPLGKRDS